MKHQLKTIDLHPLHSDQVRAHMNECLTAFQHAATLHLEACFGKKACKVQFQDLSVLVIEGLQKAWSYELRQMPHLLSFLHLCALLGLGFEEEDAFQTLGHFLKHPSWPAATKMEHARKAVQHHFETSGLIHKAKLLATATRKLKKISPEFPFVSPCLPLLGRGQEQSKRTLRVSILNGHKLYYPVIPGVHGSLMEMQAAGNPSGGYFRWQVDSCHSGSLSARGDRAWFRTSKTGKAVVTVSYFFQDQQIQCEAEILVRPAARIRITPNPIDFGKVVLGDESRGLPVQIANIGGSSLRLTKIKAPPHFQLIGDAASQKILGPNQTSLIALACKPDKVGKLKTTWTLKGDMDNPKDACVLLLAEADYAPATLDFLHGNHAEHLTIGTWENAFNPKDGRLYNSATTHFIDRDNHHFRIRVSDPRAANANKSTVTVEWWVRRDRDDCDDHKPAKVSLSLRRSDKTNTYISPPLLLVCDEDDARVPTHDGQKNGGLIETGQENHRLRYVPIDARDRLDRHVFATYQSTHKETPLHVRLPIFEREPESRRLVRVTLVNVRVSPGGKPVASKAAIEDMGNRLRSIFAPLGVFIEINDQVLEPPADNLNWPRKVVNGQDVGVAASLVFTNQDLPQKMPSPTQLQLIDCLDPDPKRIYIILVNGIYNPLTGENLEGESFYHNNTHVPLEQAADACKLLNQQFSAGETAQWLCPHGRHFESKSWTWARRNKLTKMLLEAQAIATALPTPDAPDGFFDFLNQVDTSYPKYCANAVDAAREDVYPVFYKPATLEAFLNAARGCIFLAHTNQISPYQAAHQLARVLMNECEDTGGYFSLENPKSKRSKVSDAPGHIEGKNLLHKFPLKTAKEAVYDPKRLWEQPFKGKGKNARTTPSQGETIRNNPHYCHAYPAGDTDV